MPEIEGIVIATPAHTHYTLAKSALEAGKHVFVEKPLALKHQDALNLCDLSKKKGKILMVGHLLRYHSAYQKLRELFNAGEIGNIRYIYSTRLNIGKIRREENILWSFAPHDISLILDLMNEEPYSVTSEAGYYLSNDIADTTMTHMNFSNGRKAHIFVSWIHPFKEQSFCVVGDKAMAVFNDGENWNNKLKIFRHKIHYATDQASFFVEKDAGESLKIEETEPLKKECEHFLICIKNNTSPQTDGYEGARVLKVLEMATRSIQES